MTEKMDQRTIQKILSKPFELTDWRDLLRGTFGVTNLHKEPSEISLPKNDKARAAYELGSFNTADDRSVGLYWVKLKPEVWLERNRVGLRGLLNSVYKNDIDGALIAFEQSDKWRLSFVSEIRTLDRDGKPIEQITTPKRYTYLLGKDEKTWTAADRLKIIADKDGTATLDDVRDAFSVEALTKDFYRDLFNWYQWALSDEMSVSYPNCTGTDKDKHLIQEHLIRLITRLIFVWFIKQKRLIPDTIFEEDKLKEILDDFNPTSKTKGNYYNAILQNLFFATLNRNIDEREFTTDRRFQGKNGHYGIKTLFRDNKEKSWFKLNKKKILDIFKTVPFLNGGLFECLDKETDETNTIHYFDGFSREKSKSKRAFIPNCLFFDNDNGLVSILKRYNFTIVENTPNDAEVALDPELLGKVFENLLGTYNPETKETARKQSGAFYTPREIINYMVDESLIAYLKQTVGEEHEDKYRKLLVGSSNALNDINLQIYNALRKIKILDPACGSGSFPMGILNRIIFIIEQLGLPPHISIFDLKLHLIENCIFGIDIQTIATQISKLRFFISLIVEQTPTEDANNNYGIKPLPNLETKFVTANTLIGIKKKKAGDIVANLFEDPQIEVTKKSLWEVRHLHFSADTAPKKDDCRKKDKEFREKLAKLLENNNDFAPEAAKQLAAWNPYDQNASSPFFDAEWMFGLTEGFDIVIGNPPYIQLQNDSGKLATHYENCNYKTFTRTGDIYCLFYERGYQLLKPQGRLCFITSNKWMRAGYGENTRNFFAENTNPELLIDFAGVKVFESATVDTNILMFSKVKNRQKTSACVVKKDGIKDLIDFVIQNSTPCNFKTGESWVILSPIEQRIKAKIEAVGTPLKDWDIQINYGIKTGCNEAFIIDGAKKKELIRQDPKSVEIIRPILRGRDIKRYGYEFADLWLINTHNGIKEKGVKPVNINKYPAVKKHLDRYYPELKKRQDKGDTPYHLRSCAYMEDFFRQKIIYPNMTKFMPFYLDKKGYYTNQKCFIITGNDLAYLTAFFNSNIFKICYRDNFPELLGGTRELSKIFFETIKIPPINTLMSEDFDVFVDARQNGDDSVDLRLERALILALDLCEYEEYIINYKI